MRPGENKMCFHFIKNKDKFYKIVESILEKFDYPIITDLLAWQKSLVIDLNYDPRVGLLDNSVYAWHEWYNNKKWQDPVKKLSKKLKYTDVTISSDGDLLPQEIVFHKFTGKHREKMFVHQMVVGLYLRRNRLLLKNLQECN